MKEICTYPKILSYLSNFVYENLNKELRYKLYSNNHFIRIGSFNNNIEGSLLYNLEIIFTGIKHEINNNLK